MKKCVFVFLILALVFSSILIPLKSVHAEQSNVTDILAASSKPLPPEVLEKAYSNVHKTPLPEFKVYEKNGKDEWLPVPDVINSENDSSASMLKNYDHEKGFTYTFHYYDPDYVERLAL